ncbi:MAG: winged helix-turn-helix domain-containing protein [Endozoicomonadaceae bacterium]|nr:winged helix-turn-helix domain-containing protein [Endozoicomonadaceae bacterium]
MYVSNSANSMCSVKSRVGLDCSQMILNHTAKVEDEFHVEYAVTSINKVLHKMGFTPQKPCW